MSEKKKYNFDQIIDRTGTGALKYEWLEKMFGDKQLRPFWVADMDFATPDFILDAIKKRCEHSVLGYTDRGDSFFQSIITWYATQFSRTILKEWILFSPGVVPALSFAVAALTNPGDKVVVQPPVYHPFFYAIDQNKRVRVDNPLLLKNGRFSMDLEGLEHIFRTQKPKMLLFSNPHNPGGTSWKKEELLLLGALAVKYKVIILSDEIHADLVFEPHQQNSFLGLLPELDELLIVANAGSKTFNIAGLTTSYLLIKNEYLRATITTELERLHISNGNIFGNIALETAYSVGTEWLTQVKRYLKENLDFIESYIAENIPEMGVIHPEATYLLLLDCRKFNLPQDQLVAKFKKAGLALNNGAMFGKEGEGFMRFNFASPRAVIKDALVTMRDAFVNN